MTKHGNHRTSVSALIGSPVADAAGGTFGHVREFAVAPSIFPIPALSVVVLTRPPLPATIGGKLG